MKLEKYEIAVGESFMSYEFISQGPKGKITKVVNYSDFGIANVYNLSFGDKNSFGGIDDIVRTNNGDSRKILATVASTIDQFTRIYPDKLIYVTGSTASRTRLYQMAISIFFDDIILDFDIYGYNGNVWEYFDKEINYKAFLIKRKL